MNKRLYALAGVVLLLSAISMGTVAFLQGDFNQLGKQTSTPKSRLIRIELSENGAKASSDTVQITDQTVTITEAGEYEIAGQASNLAVAVGEKVTGDVTIHLNNAQFASLSLQSTGTNVVSLDNDSSNSLAGGEFGISASNVTLNGQGNLTISAVSNYGIVAADDLVIESGNLTVESAGSGLYAAHESNENHGNLTVNGGAVTVSSSQQAGAALYASNDLTINKGTVTVQSAYEGYVGKHLMINGGTTSLTTTANGLVARDPFAQEGQTPSANIEIKDGSNTVTAAGNPLLANGNISISGGVNTFLASLAEQSVFNYSGSASLTGGTLLALGSVGLSTTGQETLSTVLSGNVGDTITIADAAGNEVASYSSPVVFTNVTYSSSSLTTGNLYYLSTSSGNYGQATVVKETTTP